VLKPFWLWVVDYFLRGKKIVLVRDDEAAGTLGISRLSLKLKHINGLRSCRERKEDGIEIDRIRISTSWENSYRITRFIE
jgi:hypothetical protein